MSFQNTKYYVKEILDTLGGLPEECSWIDYKATCNSGKEFKNKINKLVIAFLNSLQAFGKNKYIIFGISEEKEKKVKTICGLGSDKFPDDNEWQNIFQYIKPFPPYIETGTLQYKGLLLGYICILAENNRVPYYYCRNGKDNYLIRRGGNVCIMEESEKTELCNKKAEIVKNGRTYLKSDILNLLVVLGQYNSRNPFDISYIEEKTGKTYAEIKAYCLNIDNNFSQDEKSIYGLENSITVVVKEKYERLLQFTSDEIFNAMEIIYILLQNKTTEYSTELFQGITDTLIFIYNHGFSFYVKQLIEKTISLDMFQNGRHYIFSKIAEASPGFFMKLIMENKAELLAQHQSKANAIQVLRTIAWYPEYYEGAVKLLIEFNDQAVYELFMCEEIASAACYEQKLNLIKDIAKNDADLAFDILKEVLYFNPKMNRFIVHNNVPEKYKRFRECTHQLKFEQLQTYYNLLVDIAGACAEKLMKLLPDWLMPYPFSNLWHLADCIEKADPSIVSADERMNLWNRLCNTPLVYVTDEPMEKALKERFLSVGNKFKPESTMQQNKQWFRKKIQQDLRLGRSDYDGEKILEKQKMVLLSIYQNDGIYEIVNFIQSVEIDSFHLSQILSSPEFSLSIEEDTVLLSAFLFGHQKYESYLRSKSYNEKLKWVKSVKIDNLSPKYKALFFAILNPSIENIKYFENILDNDMKLYWEKVDTNMFSDNLSIQYGFKKFIEYEMPQKAFDLLEPFMISQMEKLDPEWLFNAVMKQKEYDEGYLSKSAYETAYRILFDKIDANRLEKMEQLSFWLYEKIAYYMQGYAGLKPIITFKKIANDSSYFVKIVKYIIEDPLGLWEHIMKSCDQEPKSPVNWIDGINNFMNNEEEVIKKKGEFWAGHILYNTIETDTNGEYKISDCVAELLEKSKDKRDGFFFHAYYSMNGFHTNGSFEYDSKDRKEADNYKRLADIQEKKGNSEFSKSLYKLAEQLIRSVER